MIVAFTTFPLRSMKSVSTSDAIFNMIASNSDSLHSLSDGRSPSTTTNDSNSKLSDSLEVSAPHYGETSVDRQNLLLTEVIKQLCQVSQRADDIFSRLKRDLGDIQSRSSRLHDRITVLSSKTEEIASTPVPLGKNDFL